MNAELPSAWLTLPVSGDRALPELLRKLQLLALRRLLSQPAHALTAPLGPALARVQSLFFQLAKVRSERVLLAIASPDVLGPLLCIESGALAPEVALRQAVPHLLTALALGPGGCVIDQTCLWDIPVQRVIDRATGRVFEFMPHAQGMHVARSGLELRLGSGRLWTPSAVVSQPCTDNSEVIEAQPLHRLSSELSGPEFAELDTNPLASFEAHPDKAGNALDLAGRTAADWLTALNLALSLIGCALPTLHAEFAYSLLRVVPVGFEPERHLSASYREIPGLIYLTLHPSELTLAEAIVHETQHGKLNALSWLDPVLNNGHSEWTRSPVRPDLRPLMGVLLALHAFVPVAAMHKRLAELDHPIAQTWHFAQRRREVLASNAESLAIVSSLGKPTRLGERLIRDLAALHAACA